MPLPYSLPNLKRALTRAIATGDHAHIIEVCDKALTIFDACGYPDCWQDWERAKSDSQFRRLYA